MNKPCKPARMSTRNAVETAIDLAKSDKRRTWEQLLRGNRCRNSP